MRYQNKTIVIATKHSKELVIAPPFVEHFKCKIFVPSDFDTDQFGTFTGTVQRQGSAYETVILKAKQAALKYGHDYALASEGSFGPHPTLPFVPGNIELLAFLDLVNDVVICESEITTETNYSHCDLTTKIISDEFLRNIKFPSHGVVIRAIDSNQIIAKGVMDHIHLHQSIEKAFTESKIVRLETDMRAMCNPTRMNVIARLTSKLVNRIKTECPDCHTPGFGKKSVQGSLMCSQCGAETTLYQYQVLGCVKCPHQEIKSREDGLEQADPFHCPVCNP